MKGNISKIIEGVFNNETIIGKIKCTSYFLKKSISSNILIINISIVRTALTLIKEIKKLYNKNFV